MDKLIERIIQAAEVSESNVEVKKININDLTKHSDELEKLDIIGMKSKIYYDENNNLSIDLIVEADAFGVGFLNEAFNISKRQVKKIYNSAINGFVKCTNELQELIENKIEEMDKGESKDVSED